MKTNSLFLAALIACASASQGAVAPPRVQWQITYGEPYLAEGLFDLKLQPDGGFTVFAYSEIYVAPNQLGSSYVTLRFDHNGVLLSRDVTVAPAPPPELQPPLGVRPLPGGGYLLSCSPFRPASGEDYAIAKVTQDWEPLWTRVYGGTNKDRSIGPLITVDGGFLLGGQSFSPPGETKTSPYYGGGDFWIVRLDGNGNELWQQSYGGTGQEWLAGFQQTKDGGFILGGWSASPPSGNKSSPFFGNEIIGDYWVVRLAPNGTKLWDRSFGGTEHDWLSSVQETRDGGFLLGGWSGSPPSGNKTAPFIGGNDFWLVRLDADGNKLWDKSFGGTNSNEGLGFILEQPDGGFLATGFGYRYDFTYLGAVLWRVDAAGNTLWSHTLRPGENVTVGSIVPTADGGFLVQGSSLGAGNSEDIWIAKLTGEFPDTDDDGVPDESDRCPSTRPGSVVDADGCAIDQLCPCEAANSHGQYVKCVQSESDRFVTAGLISENQRTALVKAAVKSDCGK